MPVVVARNSVGRARTCYRLHHPLLIDRVRAQPRLRKQPTQGRRVATLQYSAHAGHQRPAAAFLRTAKHTRRPAQQRARHSTRKRAREHNRGEHGPLACRLHVLCPRPAAGIPHLRKSRHVNAKASKQCCGSNLQTWSQASRGRTLRSPPGGPCSARRMCMCVGGGTLAPARVGQQRALVPPFCIYNGGARDDAQAGALPPQKGVRRRPATACRRRRTRRQSNQTVTNSRLVYAQAPRIPSRHVSRRVVCFASSVSVLCERAGNGVQCL